jgi:hypothetical protein
LIVVERSERRAVDGEGVAIARMQILAAALRERLAL